MLATVVSRGPRLTSPSAGTRTAARLLFSSTSRPLAPPSATKKSPPPPPQNWLPAAYYRGGTSRAIMVSEADLPADREQWGPIFLSCIGSPDPQYGRQLDGLGGGISSLSKVCVVGPSPPERRGAVSDVDYTFVSLGVREPTVDYSSNCGNMSAAVGPFAVDSGMLREGAGLEVADHDEGGDGSLSTTVRIFNTNTNKVIHAKFPLSVASAPSFSSSSPSSSSSSSSSYLSPSTPTPNAYEAAASGAFAIDGVPDTAAPLELRFIDPAGSRTGKLFPTGRILDTFSIPSSSSAADEQQTMTTIQATCIDASNPCVFVSASSLGVRGDLTPAQIDDHPTLKPRLEAIRRAAAARMGLASSTGEVPGSVPKIGIVSSPAAVVSSGGSDEGSSEVSRAVAVRAMSVGQPHMAVPVTVALALAAAANVEGTTVAGCVVGPASGGKNGVEAGSDDQLVVHHASGSLTVAAKFSEDGEGKLEYATVYRTARRLMEGRVFWKAG